MGTKEKLELVKGIVATVFLACTERSIAEGVQYKYESLPCDDISFGKEEEPIKGWIVNIKIKEVGYGEAKTIQQFLYIRPSNVDILNMEYNVLVDLISNLTHTALITMYETAKYLNSDKEIQKQIQDAKKGN